MLVINKLAYYPVGSNEQLINIQIWNMLQNG